MSKERIFTIDIGNTAAKGTIIEDGRVADIVVGRNDNPDSLAQWASERGVTGAIFCSVRGGDTGLAERLRAELDRPVIEFTQATPVPLEICYGSRSTLGVDRIAAAVGAHGMHGGNLLIVDAGTAVTADVVSGGSFMGGNISPGLRLRFRSLNAFTAKLPLVRPEGELPAFGTDTVTAIRSGVVRGLVGEIASEYAEAETIYHDVKLLLTGGDADFLAPLLRQRGLDCIPAHNLVGLGLELIYKYNRNE